MSRSNSNNNLSKRLSLINRYFKITRFYSFIKSTAFKGGFIAIIFIVMLLFIDSFVVDIGSLLNNLVNIIHHLLFFLFF